MRDQHHVSCRGNLPGRTPWRPFHCSSCDAIDRERAWQSAHERSTDTAFQQHGKGENP